MATREHSTSSPDTHERAVTQALTRAYAVNWAGLALAVLLLLAVITRFYDLGTRVMKACTLIIRGGCPNTASSTTRR